MSARRVRIEDHAAEEFDAAADWYDAQRAGLGTELVEAVHAAIERLAENPGLAGPVPGVADRMGARRLLVDRFPYAIVFVEEAGEFVVVAVAHGHRAPGYWVDRLPGRR